MARRRTSILSIKIKDFNAPCMDNHICKENDLHKNDRASIRKKNIICLQIPSTGKSYDVKFLLCFIYLYPLLGIYLFASKFTLSIYYFHLWVENE